MATTPEEVIRRYIDGQGGRVEAQMHHLQVSFAVERLTHEDLKAISAALADVGVSSDPALSEVGSDGELVLYVSERDAETRQQLALAHQALRELRGLSVSAEEAREALERDVAELDSARAEEERLIDAIGDAVGRLEQAERDGDASRIARCRNELDAQRIRLPDVLAAIEERRSRVEESEQRLGAARLRLREELGLTAGALTEV